MMGRRELGGPPPSPPGPSGYLIAAVAMVILCPSALFAWAWATWVRRDGRLLAPVAMATLGTAAAVVLRGQLLGIYVDLGRDFVAAFGDFAAMGAVLLQSVALTLPVGLPVGAVAGMVTARGGIAVRHRPRRQVLPPPAPPRKMERENVQRSVYLARALKSSPPGDLPPEWYRRGGYLVLPDGEAGLPRLVVGRPGRGKSVYLQRQAYLTGRGGQRLTVIDCKGEPGFASDILAAYAAGWADGGQPGRPLAHLWPQQPLNAWTGGPAVVVNRLLSCWEWDKHNAWYREVAVMGLRLALDAPAPPVASSGDLTRRMHPGVLAELWQDDPEQLALVGSLGKDLDGVLLRVANLMASLGSTLDGDQPLGTADVTVLSLPVAALENDAASILRVAMADLAHHVTVRKDPAAREQIIVDEFSAVPGGRGHAIHLTERGRSAGVAVTLAVQSRRGLGTDDEADRIVGAVGTVVLFATQEPEDIIRLAGTRRLAEQSSASVDDNGISRYTTSMVWRDQVDANVVRALAPGQAYILAGGRAQLCQVIRAPGGDRPCATAPADAVITRVSPPVPSPQEPSAPTGRPAGALDRPGRSSIRRDRPPGAGIGPSPGDDRDNQEEP